jgi:gamma-glutamyltranspeptidase/glutathione hydrolase
LAEDGFIIPKRLGHNLQVRNFPQKHVADFQAYFSNGHGGLLAAGDRLKNPAYAATLRAIAAQGMQVFRNGEIAEAMVAKLNQDPLPGGMTLDDMASYKAKTSAPVCITYRATYRVCAPRPPSGGVSLLEALKMIEQYPVNSWGKDDPRSWQVLLEAERRMYADRDKYMADEDFVPVPTDGLLADDYIKGRNASIVLSKATPAPTFGIPKGAPKFLDDKTIEPGGTTHFVIVDSYGNALSMTTTVESLFGSGRMAGGFFLNNQITDFSWSPTTPDGLRAANGVEGGKRPRSAMSPSMIFDMKGKLIGMVGSPGGPSIIAYNLKTLVGVMDFGMTMPQAVSLGHIIARGEAIRVEQDRLDPKIIQGLKDMGYALQQVQGEESGVNGLLRDEHGDFVGGADPRRNGAIRGN